MVSPRKALAVLFVAGLLVGVAGIALVLRLPGSLTTSTSSQTETSGFIQSTLASATSVESFSTNTSNATRGLELVLTIEPSHVATGGNVTVHVSLVNLLTTPQNFSLFTSDRLAYVDLHKGYITNSNASLLNQSILTVYDPLAGTCPCPRDFQTYFLLGPHQSSNQTFNWGGTWTRSGDQYVFNQFQKGVYTVEAWNPSAFFVLGYFVVADPPPT